MSKVQIQATRDIDRSKHPWKIPFVMHTIQEDDPDSFKPIPQELNDPAFGEYQDDPNWAEQILEGLD